MKKTKTILSILSITLLPVITQAHFECSTAPDTVDLTASMQGDIAYMDSAQTNANPFMLPASTVEYLLERQNRNQLVEILTIIDDVTVTQ